MVIIRKIIVENGFGLFSTKHAFTHIVLHSPAAARQYVIRVDS